MEKLLDLMENNATLSAKEIALMLSKEEGDIKEMIRKLESDGVILGYKTIIDWDKTDRVYDIFILYLMIMTAHFRK